MIQFKLDQAADFSLVIVTLLDFEKEADTVDDVACDLLMGVHKADHLVIIFDRNRHLRDIKVDIVHQATLDIFVDGTKGLGFVL